MHKDAGISFEIRFRLRGQLSHHHWKLSLCPLDNPAIEQNQLPH
jgi:hypothetical protein